MKISSFFDPQRDDPALNNNNAAPPSPAGRILRSEPPGHARRTMDAIPEPPPLDERDDHVSVSLEAAYLMVGDRYDPQFISPNDLADMTAIMIAGGAISRSEQKLILNGPSDRGYTITQAGTPRNVIAEWQTTLARAVGTSDLASVSRATRALGILGRVAATRLPE